MAVERVVNARCSWSRVEEIELDPPSIIIFIHLLLLPQYPL